MTVHMPIDVLASRLRASGVKVTVLDDAQGKSASRFASVGYYRGCQAVCLHHTVSSGEYPDNDVAYLDGGNPNGYTIANAYVGKDGVIHLIASGPTYTEGRGGPLGIIPEDRGNDVSFSMEIGNRGNNLDRYSVDQIDAVRWFTFHAAKLAAEVWDWPDDPFGPGRVFAHHEWAPGRKIDPAGPPLPRDEHGRWDMDAFRADLRTLQPDPDPPTEDDDMARYLTFHDDPKNPVFPTPVFEQAPGSFSVVHVNAERWALISKLDGVKLENAGPDAAAYRCLVGGIDAPGDWSHIIDMFGQVV